MNVYYGLTEEESKFENIVYKKNKDYNKKSVNTSLKGLKTFINDNNLSKIIKYYVKLPVDNFIVCKNILKDKKYDMIVVKLPYKFEINKIYKI